MKSTNSMKAGKGSGGAGKSKPQKASGSASKTNTGHNTGMMETKGGVDTRAPSSKNPFPNGMA